jgi:hypothetical protein
MTRIGLRPLLYIYRFFANRGPFPGGSKTTGESESREIAARKNRKIEGFDPFAVPTLALRSKPQKNSSGWKPMDQAVRHGVLPRRPKAVLTCVGQVFVFLVTGVLCAAPSRI